MNNTLALRTDESRYFHLLGEHVRILQKKFKDKLCLSSITDIYQGRFECPPLSLRISYGTLRFCLRYDSTVF